MAITGIELDKEKKWLKDVLKELDKTLNDLGADVLQDEQDLIEFKKMTWGDKSSFDSAELNQVMSANETEAKKVLMKQQYLKKLINIKDNPYFGSIIFNDKEGLENIYISYTYIKKDAYNNLVYDWRSPICSLFYDYETGPCEYTSPDGIVKGELKRKRQYKIVKRNLVSVFDNSINIDDEVLQEVLAKESTDKMKNVVNTIQKEQNAVIRNTEDNNLIVQGIAGSGKTSVALHRIAFLLYRIKNLTSGNILIFSPNSIFSEYISNVLPELGEENTLQTTFNNYMEYMINEYKKVEPFSDFIARYYTGDELNTELVKYKQSDEIITDIDDYIKEFIKKTKFISGIVENKVNEFSKETLNELLQYKYDRFPLFNRIDEIALKLSEIICDGKKTKKTIFRRLLKEALNTNFDMRKIYMDFYRSKYCRLNVSDYEIDKLKNNKSINYEDALLFTYMKGLLQGFNYENNIKQVVIDEAQDYNKLQYIIIEKIFKRADFTILGDINQNINPYYKYSSLEELNKIFTNSTKYLELLKTYRSSPEIIEYANSILNLNHVSAIRRDNNIEVLTRNTDEINVLKNDINNLKDKYNSLAVITKDDSEALKVYEKIKDDFKITLIDKDSKNFEKKLIIVPAYIAKGLEFDSVIVYNKKENKYKENEKNLFYVAVTRAQHELIVFNN